MEWIRDAVERELAKDYSWQYVPEDEKQRIISWKMEKIAEWIVVNSREIWR